MGLVSGGDFNNLDHNPFDGFKRRPSLKNKSKAQPRLERMVMQGHRVNGDFGSMGDLTSLLSSVFGKDGAAQVLQTAQQAGTTLAINQAGKFIQANPDAAAALKSTITDTSKSTFAELWNEYKTPILVLTAIGVVIAGVLVYNTIGKKKSSPAAA